MNKKLDYKILLLILITILTRIFLFKDLFHEWDSINFALAIKKFNIYADQPHPPGYPILVLISKLIYIFIKDELRSLQILSVIFSILGVIIFYYFLKYLTKNEKYSFFGTIIFSFSSIFYFYGTIEDIYVSEVFLTLLIGFLSYLTLSDKKKSYLLSIFYGLGGGIRFNSLIFFFPLILYIFIKIKLKFKEILINSLLILIFILIWYIPTIYSGGGIKNHSFHSKTLFTWVLGTSIFFDNYYWIKNTFLTFILFLKETLISIIILIYMFIKRKDNLIFLLIWIVPSLLFYFLIHAPKVGYYLTVIPPLYLFLFYKLFYFDIKYKKFIVVFLISILIINFSIRFFELRKNLDIQISYLKILIGNIEKSVQNDKKTIIFISDEKIKSFRFIPYYFPNNKIYFISPLSNYICEWNIENGYIVQYKREPMEIYEGNVIKIDEYVNKIIFICDHPRDFEEILMLEGIKIEESQGSLKGGGVTIISYEIPKDFDYIFVKGYIITKK